MIEKGCWSENTQIGFDCAGEGSSIVENSACTSVIETTSIDGNIRWGRGYIY